MSLPLGATSWHVEGRVRADWSTACAVKQDQLRSVNDDHHGEHQWHGRSLEAFLQSEYCSMLLQKDVSKPAKLESLLVS